MKPIFHVGDVVSCEGHICPVCTSCLSAAYERHNLNAALSLNCCKTGLSVANMPGVVVGTFVSILTTTRQRVYILITAIHDIVLSYGDSLKMFE